MILHRRVLQEEFCPLCPNMRTIVRGLHLAAVIEQKSRTVWCRGRCATVVQAHTVVYAQWPKCFLLVTGPPPLEQAITATAGMPSVYSKPNALRQRCFDDEHQHVAVKHCLPRVGHHLYFLAASCRGMLRQAGRTASENSCLAFHLQIVHIAGKPGQTVRTG